MRRFPAPRGRRRPPSGAPVENRRRDLRPAAVPRSAVAPSPPAACTATPVPPARSWLQSAAATCSVVAFILTGWGGDALAGLFLRNRRSTCFAVRIWAGRRLGPAGLRLLMLAVLRCGLGFRSSWTRLFEFRPTPLDEYGGEKGKHGVAKLVAPVFGARFSELVDPGALLVLHGFEHHPRGRLPPNARK